MLAKILKGVCHALHPTTILSDKEIPLREYPKAGIEVDDTSLLVLEKLGLKGNPPGERLLHAHGKHPRAH
jgi:hypothetical protein